MPFPLFLLGKLSFLCTIRSRIIVFPFRYTFNCSPPGWTKKCPYDLKAPDPAINRGKFFYSFIVRKSSVLHINVRIFSKIQIFSAHRKLDTFLLPIVKSNDLSFLLLFTFLHTCKILQDCTIFAVTYFFFIINTYLSTADSCSSIKFL